MGKNKRILYNRYMNEKLNHEIVGIMPGGFNLLHAGHLEAIRYAGKLCTRLVIVIVRDQSDKGHKLYTESIEDRYLKIRALKGVDEIIPCENEESLLELLKLLDYDRYFLSDEYREKGFEEGKVVIGEDRIAYVPRHHNWSTTNEVRKIRNE